MAVAPPPLPAFDVDDVRDSVGEPAFARGLSYARAKRVLSLAWDEGASQLTASVVGNGAIYRTTAHFARQGGNRYFVGGECSCPIAYDCKHVAAVVVSATTSPGRRLPPARTRIATPTPAPPPAWERPLRELVATREQHVAGAPLAIELSYATRHAGRDSELTARLMRPGARGKWINGSLSWRELESWHMRGTEILAGHLEVVREIAALFDAGTRRHGYYYGHSAQKTIDLATFDSRQLWHLLAEARRRGVALIHADPALGDVRLSCDGELCLDVTRHVGDLRIRPAVRLGGETAELRVLQFVGSSGHGAICADIDETGDEPPRLHLVGFAAPTPEALRRMAIGAATIEVPAREADRFAAEISPSLRHVTTLISSDASFTPPQVSPPALTLRARYGDDHELELQWLWHYAIGVEARYAAFDEPVAGYRDIAAENAAAESATQAGLDLARFALRDRDGRLRTAPVTLRGLDTAAFTTDLLPLLDEAPFTVERTGEPVDYRDASATLEVGVSTGEIAGERDWFDLGVQVTIEGRGVPLALVLTGLADGSGQLLLDDGALVSLDSPALDALRRVLADARDLPDRPGLQISRYQAGLWAELVDVTTVTGQAEAWQHQVGALLAHDELPEHDVPDGVAADLRPYQRDGFRWLAMLWEFELGGILADDMGLGKTLQALALITHARREAPERGPFLVVAPTSVVSNWLTEAQRFTPDLRVVALTDTLRKSGVNLAD
ncbi:MAG TPA: SNF2-related protein, partial [Solirubrobacteraceae bacterium]